MSTAGHARPLYRSKTVVDSFTAISFIEGEYKGPPCRVARAALRARQGLRLGEAIHHAPAQ